ncbi:MAG: hypothetical protein ABIT83_27350 [Massilia sp.]
MKILPACAPLLLALACAAGHAADPSGGSNLSNGSALVAEGSAEVIGGSLSAVALSGAVVVVSVEAAGEASVVLLKDASNGAEVSLRISGELLHKASVGAGAAISVVTLSTGYLLVASGKALAFVPNALGKQLIHHSRVERSGA